VCHNALMKCVTMHSWSVSQCTHEVCHNALMKCVTMHSWSVSQCTHEKTTAIWAEVGFCFSTHFMSCLSTRCRAHVMTVIFTLPINPPQSSLDGCPGSAFPDLLANKFQLPGMLFLWSTPRSANAVVDQGLRSRSWIFYLRPQPCRRPFTDRGKAFCSSW